MDRLGFKLGSEGIGIRRVWREGNGQLQRGVIEEEEGLFKWKIEGEI